MSALWNHLVDRAVLTLVGLFHLAPDRFWQRLCESGKGHHYSTTVIQSGDTFSIDPTTPCSLCGKAMTSDVYEALTLAYAAVLATEEVW